MIHLIVTYRQGLPNLNRLIRDTCNKYGINLPFRIAYRRDKNLKDLLTTAKLQNMNTEHQTQQVPTLDSIKKRKSPLELRSGKDLTDQVCVLCHGLEIDTNHTSSISPTVRNTRRKLLSCKQTHNNFLLTCKVCNSEEQITGLTTAHELTKNI